MKKNVKIAVSGKAKPERDISGKSVTPTSKRVIAQISVRRRKAMKALANR
ncbi:MAG: hypothetical protein OXC42_06460 [Gammaproteobacteria bacterium]|nr:hypothetical protein [Gammaproteobacteria bacterium]